jgi:hypothetical protein
VPSGLTHDERVVACLVVAFASLVTAHVAIVAGLAVRSPRWRAPAAAVVFPLAPYWGGRAGMHVRSVVWIVSAVAYVVCRWLAFR